jgi:hypothetical protein
VGRRVRARGPFDRSLRLDPARAPAAKAPADAARETFDELPVILIGKGRRNYDLRGLRLHVDRLAAQGADAFAAPLPGPDQLDASGGWIGAWYSDGQLLAAATAIYERALAGYRQLVDRWLAALRPELGPRRCCRSGSSAH